MGTKVGVFIIESRKIEEEFKKKRQGLILTEMMRLLGIKSEYRYIRTSIELKEMIKQYYKSKLRYLHLSIHGVSDNKEPVDEFRLSLEYIKYDELCNVILENDYREEKRRLFISACHVIDDIAKPFERKENSYVSIIAPSDSIKTRVAPLVWATFYNNMFGISKKSMINKNIMNNLDRTCKFYGVTFKGYFRKSESDGHYFIQSFPREKGKGSSL